ncbi:hypothetical protein EN932_11220 [Mesorhizobium sp. M7A.F.Ca.US.002.01.1.1]|uniref:hypothetical protein n=1 Tax=Mesorhizobium sp. M7A.F.Ca.US.002.01.1.1 TaxID=2496700 RepID=UPI000FD31CCF|nr:hypothetical protein [Mesorhizobium sp. M7A.F.Ca.US.002.01.1.1]RVA12734.1 hypothetical protein EN932_11220 [Mesorhizobium sp. M7A.F.Ca.US.002.01.1.1]
MIAKFCQERGLKHQTRQVQAIWPNGKYETYRLHCFSRRNCTGFLDHFEGLRFDPRRDRENGNVQGVWRRAGEYRRVLDLGPPSVPEIVRS